MPSWYPRSVPTFKRRKIGADAVVLQGMVDINFPVAWSRWLESIHLRVAW
ncbi:MAG: hypothetical protein JG774_1766 [Desulfomicrobiaceae bacterium]|jgi:hypothetical protein|nr:hypothetical protein [Desulfomicrobiaceae bacterium]